MEFFKTLEVQTSEKEIQALLSLENLVTYSNELFPLEKVENDKVQIGGIWGEFTLSLHPIANGVRFALQECPNALSWTVTTGFPREKEKVVIHLTVNRKESEMEFVEEIKEFLDDLAEGLLKTLKNYKKHPLINDFLS